MTALTEREARGVGAADPRATGIARAENGKPVPQPSRSVSALDACHRAREAWQRTQDQLDIFSVLNEQPAPALSHGLLVEGGRTERQGRDGRGWLTAAAASHAHGGCAPPPSLTNQGAPERPLHRRAGSAE